MSVGTQPTVAGVNSQLTALALTLRNNFATIANLFTCINELGGDTGLTAGFEAVGFDFANALAALWGGQ